MTHAPDEPCIAEELLSRLVTALVRAGTVPESVILQLAEEIDAEAHDETITRSAELCDMAGSLRIWAMNATGPSISERKAKIRRKLLRVIDGDEA